MANLNERKARIENKRRLSKRRKGFLAVLGCIVVFATAFALMVPAISMSKGELTCGMEEHAHSDACYTKVLVCGQDEAEAHEHSDACYESVLVCGLEEGEDHEHSDACYESQLVCGQEEQAGHTHTDACYEEQLTCDTPEHTHTDACYSHNAKKTDDAKSSSAAAAKMPAADFEKKIDRADAPAIKVKVKAPEGAFPEGTTMEAKLIADDDVKTKVEEAIERENGEDTKIKNMTAVDIVFKDASGKEIEPAKAVEVKITSDDVRDIDKPVLVHVFDKAKESSKGAIYDAEVVGKVKVVNEDDNNTVVGTEDTMKFESKAFSPYVIVELETLTAQISHEGVIYDVTVTYSPEANIPEGAWLDVTAFEEGTDDYDFARNAVLADKKAKGEFVDIADFNLAAVDISIKDADGNEIEPEAEVQVDLKVKSLPEVEDLSEVAETIEVQHLVEVPDGVVVEKVFDGSAEGAYEMDTDENIAKAGEVVDPDSVSDEDFANDDPKEVLNTSFDTEEFSTFTITWRSGGRTVTVHYVDENGEELDIANPASTYGNMTGDSSSPAFLIYDIDGYEYSYTYRNTNTTGNRIAPLLTKNSNSRWQYMGVNSTSTTELSNGDDIYVVYKKKTDPTPGGVPEVDQDEEWPEGTDAPQFSKSSTNNNNGTNTISLSIAGGEKPVEKSTPADVIVVFDVSGSMGDYMGNQTRLARAKTAVNTMANTLLNGDNSDVRMALISFSTSAATVQGFTNDYEDYRRTVNGLSADGGTNWELALMLANHMNVRQDAATFIVFVTDGDPTYRLSRGDLANSALDVRTGNTYSRYRNVDGYGYNIFGTGTTDPNNENFLSAVDQVTSINGAGKSFYAIGISNDVTKVQNLTTQGGVDSSHAFIASDSTAMENAFKSITESITSVLGFGNVEVTDGITALTNAEMKVMQTVDPSSFKYYRYGGENNKYGADYAHKTEWTTREADGCAAATYSSEDGAVHWDMGETFQLEDDVTYVVEFIVWPSQAAYDLVADLNNGLRTYDSLSNAEKAQVVEVTAPTPTTTGTYALKTNTNQVNATYNKTTESGGVVTIADTQPITATYHEGELQNMGLDSDYITVKKEWHNALDGRVADGITLTVTKDEDPYLDDVALDDDNNWTSDEQYISAGVITKTADGRYNVRETGHEYTVTEPAEFSYYWDLTADIYRPMVIDGTLTMLIKTDSPTGTEGSDYYVIGGGKYQVSATINPQLVAKNDRRSNLNLKKLVTANTQAIDNVPNPDDVFTYTITVTDSNGDDVWFSAWDENGDTVPLETYSSNVTPDPSGSYSVPSGAEFTISIKVNWNVRFFNLPTGTTYSIQETSMEDGYEFVKVETSAEVTKPEYADDYQATPGTVSGNTVTGTIDQPNNVYSTEYTNNWNPNNEIVITKTDENSTKLAGAEFKLSKFDGDDWQVITTFTSKADAGETLKVGRGLYKLEETAAPADYMQTGTVYFMVTTNGNTTTVTLANADGTAVDEEELPTIYPDATASGNEVTIKDWPLTTANALKAWKNADGSTTAPNGASVVYKLYIDGEATEYTVTLDGTADTKPTETGIVGYESDGWKATFVNLPKYKAGTTTEIEYTIAESEGYPGYNADTDEPVANNGTITNTQEATTANANKAWKNADGSKTAPAGASVVFTLYADGTATTYTVTLDGTVDEAPTGTGGYENEAWKALFVNLPKYQPGTTTPIVYTIAETTTYAGYEASTTDPVASGETITNTQGSTDTYAEKAWKNADGSTTAPEGASVVFTLYADGTATTYTVTLDGTVDEAPTGTGGYESVAWKAEFVNLPKYKAGTTTPIVYTIAETTSYAGYTASTTDPVASGSKITNTQDVTTANALKAWENADGSTTPPQGGQVTYTLYADNKATTYTVTLDGTVDTAPEVTGGYESVAWKAEFVNLPKYKAGTTTEIVYTIAESEGYPGYIADTDDPVASGETITNLQDSTTADANKAWQNADGSKTAPAGASVVFTLYADGTATTYTVTLDGTVDEAPTGTGGYENEAWKALFVNLPKYQPGTTTPIVYTIAETTTYPGYVKSPAIPVAIGETITNTQESTTANAFKGWKDADGDQMTAPEGASVVFTLYADDVATTYTVTLDGTVDEAPTGTGGYESVAWKAEFVNLPKSKIVNGKAEDIVYTVAETTTYPGYEASTTDPVTSGEIIYNSQLSAEIKLLKIGDAVTSTTLDGAQFELYSVWKGPDATDNVKARNASGEPVGTITTAGGGLATIGKLLPGTYYLVETKAPDGYNALADAVEIRIQIDENNPAGYTVSYTQNDYAPSSEAGNLDPDTSGSYQITVSDPSGSQLPMTGGAGTTPFTLGGIALVVIAACVYGFGSRRGRERGSQS